MEIRINKFIAENSEISRRKADELINQGRVSVNGKILNEPGLKIIPGKDRIEVEGKIISNQEKKFIYIALHKPAGYITTRKDELNRPTVMELIPKNKNLKAVGRLDKDTEGLLFFSNDGHFINHHTHPKFECEKEYYALIKGSLSDSDKEKLESGIFIEERKTAPAKIKIIRRSKTETELKITIHEGRKRQIRKMFDHVNSPVKYLQRIRIGKVRLGSLKKGEFRALNKEEIDAD